MSFETDPSIHKRLEAWIKEKGVAEIELILPDMNGIIRGKVVPASRFLRGVSQRTLRIASSILTVTVTGEYPDYEGEEEDMYSGTLDPDCVLVPDPESICLAPGYRTPTAYVVTDAYNHRGELIDIAPRQVLRRVLDLYASKGWTPVVAPEVEFFLTARNVDPDLPLETPAGRSGRAETVSQPYGLEAINEYEDLIEQIYEYCEIAELDIETMIHEAGAAQLEVNFNHGDAMDLADQVLMFKRIVRQVALANNVYATFMAKPMDNQPGSAMHIHQSLTDKATGRNLFANQNGSDSALFRSYVGGLQTYLPEVAPIFAPNVNSFRRMRPQFDAPINVQWGLDNRSCGLRTPISDGRNRRIENRLPGADANPYLAIASSLACGWVGMQQGLEPGPQITASAYKMPRSLPRTLDEALMRFKHCAPMREVLGEGFCSVFAAVKLDELDAFEGVVSAWEREHLLLKV
jgi:glutamine synthetase